MATPATRDMEIEILAGLQEMLAQQAIALRMLRRLHNTVDQWIQRRVQETEGERGGGRASRSRSPLRPTPAEVDRLRYQRGRHAMSETVAWEEARQEDPNDPIEDPTGPTDPPVEEMPTIPGITMASGVLPAGLQSAADTVDPTLIRALPKQWVTVTNTQVHRLVYMIAPKGSVVLTLSVSLIADVIFLELSAISGKFVIMLSWNSERRLTMSLLEFMAKKILVKRNQMAKNQRLHVIESKLAEDSCVPDEDQTMGDVEKVKQIHRFLAAQKLPDSDFQQLVQKHAESLCHSLREKPLSWEDVANIAEHLKDGPWSEAQHTMLSQAMSEGADRGEQRTTRRPNQTCRDFSPYWSVGDLDILKGNKPLAEKLDTIASRM
eukprot:symbB.v1.2.039592.t1/scaffold6669.1/size16315/1